MSNDFEKVSPLPFFLGGLGAGFGVFLELPEFPFFDFPDFDFPDFDMATEDLRIQQKLVLERLKDNLHIIDSATDYIENRAFKIGSITVAAATLVLGSNYFRDPANCWEFMLQILVGIAALLACFFMFKVWSARSVKLPGASDPQELYDDILSKEPDEAFNEVLIDACDAFRVNKEANTAKAFWFSALYWVCVAELILLFVYFLVLQVPSG